MESFRLGSAFISASMSEVLPAPEGAVMTNSRPFLLKVLDLLADLLDQQLELEGAVGHRGARRLGGEGIRLPVQLLREEIQALADRAAGAQHALHLAQMGAQPVELLGDVGLRSEQRNLGSDAFIVGAAERLAQPFRDLLLVGGD